MIIDFHTHTFPDAIAQNAVDTLILLIILKKGLENHAEQKYAFPASQPRHVMDNHRI